MSVLQAPRGVELLRHAAVRRSPPPAGSSPFRQTATVATPRRVALGELRRLMARDPSVELLDVRSPDEFAEVRVPRARNLPLGTLLAAQLLADQAVDGHRPIYLICQAESRSQIAAEKFLAAGHPAPVVVAGGTLAWIAASLPVERGEAGRHSATTRLRSGPR